MTAMIIDGVIVLLLAGSLIYGYRVSRKVQILMQTLRELEPLVDQFSFAVDKSEASVNNMRASITEAERKAETRPRDAYDEPEAAPSMHMPFLRKSKQEPEFPGVKVVRDKSDLVKRFFEASRSEQKA